MKANRGFLDFERQSDLTVLAPACYEFQHFKFTLAQGFCLYLHGIHCLSPFQCFCDEGYDVAAIEIVPITPPRYGLTDKSILFYTSQDAKQDAKRGGTIAVCTHRVF